MTITSAIKRTSAAVVAALAVVAWAVLPTNTTDYVPGEVIASATRASDVQITGTTAAPQTLFTTPPTYFDGDPVVVEFTAEYLNHLPAAGTQLNGIGFDLVIDGVRMERIALAGTHSTNNDFWPIVIRDVLNAAPRLIPEGEHTVGIIVWRWNAQQDGYLTAHPGYQSGWGMPMRLTIYAG